MAATVTRMMPKGFFPYPDQFIIHYSLMLPMFQLILTELLTDTVNEL